MKKYKLEEHTFSIVKHFEKYESIAQFICISTGKETQEEQTNTCDLLVYVALRVLLDIQLIYDCYLDLLHFVS